MLRTTGSAWSPRVRTQALYLGGDGDPLLRRAPSLLLPGAARSLQTLRSHRATLPRPRLGSAKPNTSGFFCETLCSPSALTAFAPAYCSRARGDGAAQCPQVGGSWGPTSPRLSGTHVPWSTGCPLRSPVSHTLMNKLLQREPAHLHSPSSLLLPPCSSSSHPAPSHGPSSSSVCPVQNAVLPLSHPKHRAWLPGLQHFWEKVPLLHASSATMFRREACSNHPPSPSPRTQCPSW